MGAETIRLGRVLTNSRANGPGLRDVYWTTGCSIRCPGCINPHYLDATSGVTVSRRAIEELILKRSREIEGVTFSGGEPTDQAAAVSQLSSYAHSLGLSVVIFTGRTKMECERHTLWRTVLAHCDLLIAGPYEVANRARTQLLLASTNQQIHFLSKRYTEEDLRQIPDLELQINSEAIAITGVYLPINGLRPIEGAS